MSIRNSIFMTLLAAALLTACDNIPVSDRTTPLDASSFKKPVVVVDFTGVDCTNCPKAAKVLSSMHEQVGEKIIGIAMYPDCSFNHHATFDLKCPEATEYYKAFGDLSKIVLPSGMVDFVQYKTQYIFDYTLWNSAVLERITQDTPIEVSLTVTKETKGDTTNLNIASKVTAQSAVSGSTALILWLVEDGRLPKRRRYSSQRLRTQPRTAYCYQRSVGRKHIALHGRHSGEDSELRGEKR